MRSGAELVKRRRIKEISNVRANVQLLLSGDLSLEYIKYKPLPATQPRSQST